MRIRHLSGAVATLMVAPALTVLPVAQPSATPKPTPVPTSERRVDLLDADAPQAGDADQTGAADLKLARDQMRGAGSAEREAAGTPSAAAAPEPARPVPTTTTVNFLPLSGLTSLTRPVDDPMRSRGHPGESSRRGGGRW